MLWILQPTVDLRRKLIQAYFHVNPRNGVTWSRHFYLWQILDDTDQKLHITKIIHEIDPHGKLKFDSQSGKEGTNDGCAYQKLCWRRDPLILIFLYHSLANSFSFSESNCTCRVCECLWQCEWWDEKCMNGEKDVVGADKVVLAIVPLSIYINLSVHTCDSFYPSPYIHPESLRSKRKIDWTPIVMLSVYWQ